MNKARTIIFRMMATFLVSALGVVGAGAIAGVDVLTAALMAGIGGVATVVEALSRAYLSDGKLTIAEINESFSKVNNEKD
jgi:hypothetical protein